MFPKERIRKELKKIDDILCLSEDDIIHDYGQSSIEIIKDKIWDLWFDLERNSNGRSKEII